MTNFLFVSIEALSIDLARQLKMEGHGVKFFTRSQDEKDVGDGFVEKVGDWEPLKDWANVIVFDDIGFGDTADKLSISLRSREQANAGKERTKKRSKEINATLNAD